SERAADIPADHAYLRLGQADRLRYLRPHVEWNLGRGPHADATVAIGLGDHRIAFDRNRGEPLIDESPAHHDAGVTQGAFLPEVEVERDVVALVGMDQR